MKRIVATALIAGALLTPGIAFAQGMRDGASLNPMRAAAVERMKAADTDGDGKLSQAEIYAERAGRAAQIDTDGDKTISAAELDTYMKQRRTEAMMKALDTDGDGKVTVDEFARARGPMMHKAGFGHSERGDHHRGGDRHGRCS